MWRRTASPVGCVGLAFSIVAITGCGRSLSASHADAIVSKHPAAKGLQPISTEAVSKSSDTETITRTRIGDEVFNLKFRRFDKGWAWEFVETKAGGWISADETLTVLQERARQKRVTAWAEKHESEYASTVKAMDDYSDGLPRKPEDAFTVTVWQSHRALMAKLGRSVMEASKDPAIRQRAAAQFEHDTNPAKDAWGREILLHFDSLKRRATFLSLGPDGAKDTKDDVVCVVSGTENWDRSYHAVLWDYTKNWLLPEGLHEAVNKGAYRQADRHAEFARLVD